MDAARHAHDSMRFTFIHIHILITLCLIFVHCSLSVCSALSARRPISIHRWISAGIIPVLYLSCDICFPPLIRYPLIVYYPFVTL
ncbi:hypothetical protein HOY82DRAFT_549956 [Tuber indicum]|nr:hypothetical protein HOY82DRAFT_549956 [Tuber indicum]